MKRISSYCGGIFIIIHMVSVTPAMAQDCDCLSEFRFVKQFIEKNHGGFFVNIKTPDESKYKAFTDKLEDAIRSDPSPSRCIVYLKRYIHYLKDHHSNIIPAGRLVNENDPAQLDSFLHSVTFLQRERISIDSAAITRQLARTADTLEGVYSTPDSVYVVALIRNQNTRRDYAAVILSTKAKTWRQGQVKFELKKINDSIYERIMYRRDHSGDYDLLPAVYGAPVLTGWIKWYPVSSLPKNIQQISTQLVDFKVLDAQTSMISIRSFDAFRSKQLDSAYRKIIPEILKYPNLIIDVRNNGGGTDANFFALMPLLYTDAITVDMVDTYNTPANRKAYADYDSSIRANGNRGVFADDLERVKGHADYSLVPMGSGRSSIRNYRPAENAPTRIAILYNRNCASSCESMLFQAMYSKKTIFVGENSGGYTGYGNVMSIRTPCGNTLNWTTTVSRKEQAYEFIGIPPHYRIPANEPDWVAYTQKLLNEGKSF
jgi:hypothetical protein